MSDQELWRVTSIREFMGKPMRHTKWFHTEDGANGYADWLRDGRATEVTVKKYIEDETYHQQD